MYHREDFIQLKVMTKPQLKSAYDEAITLYFDTLEYTDYLEKNPEIGAFGREVYALTVQEVVSPLGNIEKYISAICEQLDGYSIVEPAEAPIVLNRKKKKSILTPLI